MAEHDASDSIVTLVTGEEIEITPEATLEIKFSGDSEIGGIGTFIIKDSISRD